MEYILGENRSSSFRNTYKGYFSSSGRGEEMCCITWNLLHENRTGSFRDSYKECCRGGGSWLVQGVGGHHNP